LNVPSEQINVDHRLERIGAHPNRRRQEISRSTRQHNIDFAKTIAASGKGFCHLCIVADVASHANGAFANRSRRRCDFVFTAADDHDLCTSGGIALGDAQVDARGRPGDKGNLPCQ
jgi:hypothetical protein